MIFSSWWDIRTYSVIHTTEMAVDGFADIAWVIYFKIPFSNLGYNTNSYLLCFPMRPLIRLHVMSPADLYSLNFLS